MKQATGACGFLSLFLFQSPQAEVVVTTSGPLVEAPEDRRQQPLSGRACPASTSGPLVVTILGRLWPTRTTNGPSPISSPLLANLQKPSSLHDSPALGTANETLARKKFSADLLAPALENAGPVESFA